MRIVDRSALWIGFCALIPVSSQAQSAAEPPVMISISVNQSTNAEIEQGWPVMILGSVLHRNQYSEGASVVSIMAVGGTWVGAFHLVVTDDAGIELAGLAESEYDSPGNLVLDGQNSGRLGWSISPDDTAMLPVGTYHLTAYLDSTSLAQPHDGMEKVESVPVKVSIVSPNPAPTPDLAAAKRLQFANYYLMKGSESEAFQEANQLLIEQPASILGLVYLAKFHHMFGRMFEALPLYEAAVAAYYDTNPDPDETPPGLVTEYYDLLGEIDALKLFMVEVSSKTPLHPYFDQGYTEGYSMDGAEGGELWLYQDTTYTFHMVNVPVDNPFYFSTSATGNGDEIYSDGVTGQPATGNEEVTITPSAATPDVIYYQSMNQANMGWRIHIIRDAGATGVAPQPVTRPIEYHLGAAYPNPFSEETRLDLTIAKPQRVVATLYNVRGQEVLEVFDRYVTATGSQEILVNGDGLASGWYIIRVRGETFSAARGLILVR